MKKLVSCLGLLFFYGATAFGATLAATSSETRSGGLFNYAYTFTISGTGAGFDNIFLGSDDLSPLNVKILLNGAATSDWSWLGEDTPQNFLQFFSLDGATLNVGSSLAVSFTSGLAPATSHFAIAENSRTGAVSNEATGVLAPTTAIPEPVSAACIGLVAGVGLLYAGLKRRAA